MKAENLGIAMLRERLAVRRPPGRHDNVVPGARRSQRATGANIFPVSKDVEDTRGPGAKYLDGILIKLGFKGNAELSRMTGVSEGLLWKWRNDKASPTNKNLRKVVRVIVPLCRAAGIPVDPVEFYVRFDLISRDELETEPADDLFLELIRVDQEAGQIDAEAQESLREMVWFIVDGTRRRLDEKRAAEPGTSRGTKAS